MTTHKGFYRNFFTFDTEAPALVCPVSPATRCLFYRAGSAPDPLLHKHFGEGHTVKTNQPTRVLPRHACIVGHITIRR
jgi:hypothetical protein